jgi:hypothetical protein
MPNPNRVRGLRVDEVVLTERFPSLPPAETVLPAGADLRMTWPERQLAVRRMEYRRGMHTLANTELPFLPDFIAKVGGKMPETMRALTGTTYAKDMEEFWSKASGRVGGEIADLMLNAGVRYAYAVEWWEYEGRRAYLLDATTAHALQHTDISDFPARELRFPVRSFFIRLPQELGWELSMDRPEAKLSLPVSSHPEIVQPLDGVHITLDGPSENPRALQIIIAGRSNLALEGDHVIWGELSLRHPQAPDMTLGDVIHQNMQAEDRWAARYDIDRKIIQMAFGALLYITSSHPDLRPIVPPAAGTLSRQERTGGPDVRARAKARSRYTITYVGGAASGFKEARTSTGEASDMTRQPPRPHVRVGHFRHVWLGPRDSSERRAEVRWIQPVTVGSWDRVAAWRAEVGYRMVIGKTRPAEVATAPLPQA